MTCVNLGADPNEQSDNNQTALHHAAYLENLAIMESLVEAGASIDADDDHGITPVMCAAEGLTTDGLKFLVEKGANLTHKDEYGHGVLDSAIKVGNGRCLEYLGTLPEFSASKLTGPEVVQLAITSASLNNAEALRFFAKRDPDSIRNSNSRGETAIVAATTASSNAAMLYLLEEGIDPNSLGSMEPGHRGDRRTAADGRSQICTYRMRSIAGRRWR